jgi:2,3-dihydroxy-p-cumate/2,3-dihydroxybenzoate 3,4-dioxygenase
VIEIEQLRYVRLGTRNLPAAVDFAQRILGLQLIERNDEQATFRSDFRDHTLVYEVGDPMQQSVGLEVRTQATLDRAIAALAATGITATAAHAQALARRKARAMASFRDHSGARYHGTRDAGITQFSHVGLCTTDAARDEAFWTQVCNARVSDRVGDAPLLRINEVHHSIAMFPTDRSGIQHINHQVESADDVMRSFRFLKERQVRIVFGPGRHPSSSAKFLYFEGPDGMVFEYSSGVKMIADELLYRERQLTFDPAGFCEWGAKPDVPEFRS